MVVSSLMPYAGPLLKLALKRCCCCCKRQSYKPNTHLNPQFPIVRKYASVLNVAFMCVTYGFAIPPLVLAGSLVICAQFIIDKLLITYYFKEHVLHDDLLDRITLRILKYTVPLFFFASGMTIAANEYAFVNNTRPKERVMTLYGRFHMNR